METEILAHCYVRYTAKNATGLLQVVNFTGSSQIVDKLQQACQFHQVATSLSISSSCNKFVKIRLVATCHLQTCYTLLKQLASSLWITSFENQLATSLLTTCNRLVVNRLSQAMRTHPDIGLLKQVVTRCQQTCCNWRVFGCVTPCRTQRKVDISRRDCKCQEPLD